MNKSIFILLLVMTLTSCDKTTIYDVSYGNYINYKITTTTSYDDAPAVAKTVLTATMQDNKLLTETFEQFIGAESQGATTVQRYFYENGLLVKRAYENDVRHFFYDADQNLVGLTWEMNASELYYRFTHNPNNTVYFERLSAPYNDPSATASSRIVIEFDAQDNVVKAGADNDFDGILTQFNTFNYDSGNNLTTANKYDGTVVNFTYSDIYDNFISLALNTYGKRTLMIVNAECYANFLTDGMKLSPKLTNQDLTEAAYETYGYPLYIRRLKTEPLSDPVGERTTDTFFTFD